MKKMFPLAVCCAGLLAATALAVPDHHEEDGKEPKAVTLVVPQGDGKFTLEEDEVLAVEMKAIAGSTYTMVMDGPVKVVGVYDVKRLVGGRMPLGAQPRTYHFAATGTGKASVSVNAEGPGGASQRSLTFEVVKAANDG